MLHWSILTFAALASLSSLSRADVTLFVTPSSPIISVGDSFLVGLGVSGLGEGNTIAGYDVGVGFDPRLISLREVHFGDPRLGDQLHLEASAPATASASLFETGLVQILEVSQDPAFALEQGQPASFLLATLTFQAEKRGHATFTLAIHGLTDPAGLSLTATATGSTIAIVPLPAASLLMASSLVTLLIAILSGRTARSNPR